MELLASNGLLFISIDDNELPNLRRLCDELFGDGSFMLTFVGDADKLPTAEMRTRPHLTTSTSFAIRSLRVP